MLLCRGLDGDLPRCKGKDFPLFCSIGWLIDWLVVSLQVVLGLRSSPEAWLKSYNETIGVVRNNNVWYFSAYLIPVTRWLKQFGQYWETLSQERYGVPVPSVKSYTRHNDYIRRVVPKDRLLEFEPSQGWGPLCEFLGQPVPSIPYPRLNDTKRMQRSIFWSQFVGGFLWALTGLAVYGGWKVLTSFDPHDILGSVGW
jgi:Sulfotransferase domain